MGSKVQSKSRGTRGAERKTKKKENITHCSVCGFKSNRAFNVTRHYERIHDPAKRELKCCGSTYATKGELYQHCADAHPQTRRFTFTSYNKYKISTTVKKETRTSSRRRSSRHVRTKREEQDVDFNEDKPLIYYLNRLKNPELIKKEVENKFEDQLDLKDSIKVFFKGNTESKLHPILQKEFLRYINFDSFRLT